MRMMDEDDEEEDEEDAGRHIRMISVTKQLDVHDTGLVGDGRGRTGDFPTTYRLERADVLGGVYRGRLRAGLGITTWRRARTDALGSHADVLMFIACLRKT
jgi:hypothetical protein